jgi:hypothetical protein
MVKYLSAAWFGQLDDRADSVVIPSSEGVPTGEKPLVLRQIVTGGPDGDVRYDVVVRDGHSTIDPTASADADLIFTSDYATASAIGSGRLSTQAALSAGRLRVSGDVTVLAASSGVVATDDPIPAELRAATEY